jgi:hypothetical protein
MSASEDLLSGLISGKKTPGSQFERVKKDGVDKQANHR